jgi:hypothetical protein
MRFEAYVGVFIIVERTSVCYLHMFVLYNFEVLGYVSIHFFYPLGTFLLVSAFFVVHYSISLYNYIGNISY